MTKRFFCFLLVLCLLPFGAFALDRDRGSDCFDYLKEYLFAHGEITDGGWLYSGEEKGETNITVTLFFAPETDTLVFGAYADAQGKYNASLAVPSSLQMPYDAEQTMKMGALVNLSNAAKIRSDFTREGKLEITGETYGVDDVSRLFSNALALMLRHVQDNILADSDFTIADLGFTALYAELYPSAQPTTSPEPTSSPEPTAAPCDGGEDCPSRVFTDVKRSGWYHLAMDWAVTEKITTGLTKTTFGPGESCTRAQMVTFLWRAAGAEEPTLTTHNFVDVPSGKFYTKAVLWALENHITTGTDKTHFSPDAHVSRAQTVTFLWRLADKPEAVRAQAFADVSPKAYYAPAVAWAAEQGVTTGMGDGKFAPANDCTRAEIVTFLYRALA